MTNARGMTGFIGWQPIGDAVMDGRAALVYRPLAHMSHDENIAIKKLIGGNNFCWDCTVPGGKEPYNPTSGSCHVTHFAELIPPPNQSEPSPA
jgi:hypothetical protein